MLKRGLALILCVILLLGVLPVSAVAAEEERCTLCHQQKIVQRNWIVGKVVVGQQLLSSGVNVALEYPNNAPPHVDTAAEKAAWIADQCRAKGITDPWQIALWLHDWLIYNADYDCTYSIYTADGVLLQGTGVCDSYTRAYILLLQQFGIESIRLTSDPMNHAWNLVKIDGQWCHIDVTWDDPIDVDGHGGYENHKYFGLTDERMGSDHTWDRSDPSYPPCTSDINYYPIRMGLAFTNEQELKALLDKYAGEKREVIETWYLGNDPDFPIFDHFYAWVEDTYWEGIFTSCSYSLDGNNLKVYLTYPGQTGGSHIHQYQAIVQDPGCEVKGYTTYVCETCGDQYTDDYTNALGHTGGTATCIEKAVCTRCEKAYGELKPDNHAGGLEVKNTKTPTCTEPGYTGDTYCVGCGVKVSSGETIAPAGHVAQPIPTVPATCTTPGASGGEKCYVCGEVLKPQQVLPATGHLWTSGNCYAPKTCVICGEIGAAAGHTYSHAYDYKCDICGETRTVDMTRPMVDMFRMYNPNTGEHFYTGSEVEKNNLIVAGWQYEGVGFTFPLTTGKPVHRLFDPITGEHLYTMDEEEKAKLMAEGWNYEGIAFNSGFENEVPQYRLHNPNATVGAYHFTASPIERDNLLAAGWEYQGIGWYSLGA